jgi:hypothetical protein
MPITSVTYVLKIVITYAGIAKTNASSFLGNSLREQGINWHGKS